MKCRIACAPRTVGRCQGQPNSHSAFHLGESAMKNLFWTPAFAIAVLTAFMSSCDSKSGASSEGIKLQGAGASFPAPLYNKWFKAYGAAHPDVQVDYQSVGSGSGKKSVIDKTVDFGASDAAMKEEEMGRVTGGVQLLPMTAGAIVIAYHV